MKTYKTVPLYRQLTLTLRRELSERHYALGARLPPMRELADQFHCSLITVQQAIRALTEEGLLVSDSTRGIQVRAFPATSTPSGRIVCLFPKWDTLQTESFAAQFLLGAGLAATATGFSAEPFAFDTPSDLQPILNRLCRHPPAGVVWANPYASEPLARLKEAGVRTVTAIRHYPEASLPYTFDAMDEALPRLIKGFRNRGVKRLGILTLGTADPTYQPYLEKLLAVAATHDLAVAPELVCHVRTPGLDAHAQRILLRDLLTRLHPGDGLYSFAPDSLALVIEVAQELGRDLRQECTLGVLSIRTGLLPTVSIRMESDIRAHGEQAVMLIHRWLQTNTPPQPVAIPVSLRPD